MGRGGLYFRASLPSNPNDSRSSPPALPEIPISDARLEEIESGSTLQMVDSTSAALLEEINSKAKTMRIWPLIVTGSVLSLLAMVALSAPVWTVCLAVGACSGGVYASILRDRLKKTVILFYEMEPHLEESYQALHNSFDRMRACQKAWHVEARGDVRGLYEWKTSGGAEILLRRKSVLLRQGAPSYFKTNVSVPVVPAGRQTLYFFPDRLLVYAPEGVGAVSYDGLEISWGESRFIESGGVPADARVIDRTWRYVNKSGGPDKRFKDNREIPIALYGVVQIGSASGLKEVFQLSRTGIGQEFEKAVKGLAAALNFRESNLLNKFITCPCSNCSNRIEFPYDGVGQSIVCPHCGLDTTLFMPAAI